MGIKKVTQSNIPTKYGDFKLVVLADDAKKEDYLVLVKGDVKGKHEIPVRVHSACLTSEVFGSCRCDCKQQLDFAMESINEKGYGVVFYLFQEGRGIGIVNKIRAYSYQDLGMDTVEANRILGLPEENREYAIIGQLLDFLGVESVSLLTNNPHKIKELSDAGVKIDMVLPIEIDPTDDCEKYLKTKKEKMGHILNKV